MPVYVTQYLCEQRHCIVTMAWEDGGAETRDTVEHKLLSITREMKINPWCGLCGSAKLHFEHALSPFATLAEAMPSLNECQEAQRLTREHFARQPKPN